MTETAEIPEIPEIPESAPLWNCAEIPENPEIPESAPLWNCDVTCDVSHPQSDSRDSCDSRDNHDSQGDSHQQSQGHGQDIQTWPSNSQTYTTTDGIPKKGSNEKLSLAWAEDSTMNGRLDPGNINFFKNNQFLASEKGEGRQIARREIEAKRIKLGSSQSELIENEVRIRRSLEQKPINTPGNINQTISTTASFQSVDYTAEEESCYPAPPDRSAAETDFRN